MWRWVEKRLLLVLHDESLAMHGGVSGMRDEGLLDSALARREHLAAHGEEQMQQRRTVSVFRFRCRSESSKMPHFMNFQEKQ